MQKVTKANFDTWLKDTLLLEIKEGVAIIGTPTSFTKEWLEKIFYGLIEKALIEVVKEDVKELQFYVLTRA